MGFFKVLASCLQTRDLQNLLSSVIKGILPWSAVSRNHFRSKACKFLSHGHFLGRVWVEWAGVGGREGGNTHVLFNFSHLFNRILVQCLQVTVILEIMIRKCGFSAVESVTPDRYRSFVKSVVEVAFPFLCCWLISKNFPNFWII